MLKSWIDLRVLLKKIKQFTTLNIVSIMLFQLLLIINFYSIDNGLKITVFDERN